MSDAIEIQSFEQFKNENGKTVDKVTIISNEKKELLLTIKKPSNTQVLSFQELSNQLDSDGKEIKNPLSQQYDVAIKMLSMVVINDSGNLIFESDEAVNYLRDNFPISELSKIVEKAMELCGLSTDKLVKTEKN